MDQVNVNLKAIQFLHYILLRLESILKRATTQNLLDQTLKNMTMNAPRAKLWGYSGNEHQGQAGLRFQLLQGGFGAVLCKDGGERCLRGSE